MNIPNRVLTLTDKAISASLQATCRLYIESDRGSEMPVPFGCGILLQFNGHYYLLSNNHVLNNKEKKRCFVITGKGERIFLGGTLRYATSFGSQNGERDNADIAILALVPA